MSNSFSPHVDDQESEGFTIRISRDMLVGAAVVILVTVGVSLYVIARDAAAVSTSGGLW